MGCREACRVNRRLLPVKASYFFTLGAVASLFPYLGVYMKQLGLSPGETAIIYGTMPFLGAFVRTAVGALADKLHRHKLVLLICCINAGISHLCILAIPPVSHVAPSVDTSPEVHILCENQQSRIRYCTDTRLLPGRDCHVPAQTIKNMTSSSPDPFRNSSDCTLQCELNLDNSQYQDGSPCFMPAGTNDYHQCSDKLLKENDSLSELEFILEEMNHSLTQFQFDPLTQESLVCHTYSMSTFLYNGTTYQKMFCKHPTWLNCHVKCQDFMRATLASNCAPDSRDYKQKFGKTFWLFFAVYLIGTIFHSPVFSLIDAMTYDFLGEERGKWGKQRLWGTVGFALTGAAVGFSMDTYSQNRGPVNYIISFILFAALNILAGVCVCLYKISSALTCTHMVRNICMLLQRLEVTSLFLVVLVQGMLNGVIETFLFWHLQTLGASQILLGLCVLTMCLLEIPILFAAGYIIRKIGQFHCLSLSFLAMAGRFVSYSFLSNPWYVLLVEPLHTLTFGLMYAAASSYVSIITPPGMHGTVQGIIGALYFGIGKGVGSVLGGQVFEKFGPVITFRACAALSVATLVLYFICQLYLTHCSSREQAEEEDKVDHKKDLVSKESIVISNNQKLDGIRDRVQTYPKPRSKIPNSHSGLTDPLVPSETNIGSETTV